MSGFVVDLYYLEKTAKDHLPTLVTIYGNAIGKLNGAKTARDGVSAVPEEFQGGGTSVAQGYAELHQALSGVLSSTQTSLDLTAEAVHKAVRLYAENEQGVQDKLRAEIEDRGDLKPDLESAPPESELHQR